MVGNWNLECGNIAVYYFFIGFYGGLQVHSEFRMTLPKLNLTPNSSTPIQILKAEHSEFFNLTPNSTTSRWFVVLHSK